MRISDWSSDVCSSDLHDQRQADPVTHGGGDWAKSGPLTPTPLPLCGRGATGRWWRLAGSRGAVGGLAPVCGAGLCRWSWVGGMVGRVGLGVPFDEVFP